MQVENLSSEGNVLSWGLIKSGKIAKRRSSSIMWLYLDLGLKLVELTAFVRSSTLGYHYNKGTYFSACIILHILFFSENRTIKSNTTSLENGHVF